MDYLITIHKITILSTLVMATAISFSCRETEDLETHKIPATTEEERVPSRTVEADKNEDNQEEASEPRTVLVIDDGFHLNSEVFDGKIVGQYSINCSAPEPGAELEVIDFESWKKKTMEDIKKPSKARLLKNS